MIEKIKDFIKSRNDFFRSLIRSGPASLSSNRFMFIISGLISNISIFGLWVVLSLYQGKLLPIDTTILELYALANGLSIGGKLIQKKIEAGATWVNPQEVPPIKPTTPLPTNKPQPESNPEG